MEKKKNTQGGNDEHGRRKGEIWPNPSKIWTTCNFLGRPLISSLGWGITKQGKPIVNWIQRRLFKNWGERGWVEKEKINTKGKKNKSRKNGSTFFFPPRRGKMASGKFVPPSTHGSKIDPWWYPNKGVFETTWCQNVFLRTM